MTLSKKQRRKIVVEGKTYFWQATGNDGWIDLCVTGEVKGGQKLLTRFDYQYSPVAPPSPGEIYADQFVVTPYIVRQVIEFALGAGWKPFEKGSDLILPVDDKIDLRLDKNMTVNEKKFWLEVSLRMTNRSGTS
jgi:hypothetical protein